MYVIMIIDVVVGVFRLFCLTFSGFVALCYCCCVLRFDLSPFRLIIVVNTSHGLVFCNIRPVLEHAVHTHKTKTI